MRSAHTVWDGDLLGGKGTVTFDSSGIGRQPVSWPSRTEDAKGGTSPEELIAAAHSSIPGPSTVPTLTCGDHVR